MNKKNMILLGCVTVALFLGLSVYSVNETQRAIVSRLGKIIMTSKNQPEVLGPGLHFKIPLIDNVKLLDRRIQSLEISSSSIPTVEKKELQVDLFSKWRIVDFAKFYTSTGGDNTKAERLLKEKIVDGLRAEIGRRNLNDVVAVERQNIMDKIRSDANNKTAKPLGIEVVDARIVRVDLPEAVSQAVYKLMITERNRVASEHRAKGRSKAEAIRADADAKVIIIGATAEREANLTKGEGDAKASEIYAAVYGQDPEFYSFYRSLEAYRETFKNKNDILVIKPDDAFFKYFRKSQSNGR